MSERELDEPEQEPEGSLSLLRRHTQASRDKWAYQALINAWRLDARPRSEGGRGCYVRDGNYVVTDPVKPALCAGHMSLWRVVGSGRLVCGVCHPPAEGLKVEWL